MTYLLMIWMTIGSTQSFASHQFNNKDTCKTFAHWLVRDQHLNNAKAFCIDLNEGWEI